MYQRALGQADATMIPGASSSASSGSRSNRSPHRRRYERQPKSPGFRNAQNFTTAIYFHCGWLDLFPR